MADYTDIQILPPADVLETLASTVRVDTVILDPWYNRGVGEFKVDYDNWLERVICMSCEVSDHVFVWGFPDILATQISRIPAGFSLNAWLTWYYKNCPSRVKGWRPAQNACLHISSDNANVYPEHFMNDKQKERYKNGKMRFIPGPPTVIEVPLNVGFVGKSEQTEHPAQKPIAVIDPLVKMTTKEGDAVLDPMCGAGTTGIVCAGLNRKSILCDKSEEYLLITKERVEKYYFRNGRQKRDNQGTLLTEIN